MSKPSLKVTSDFTEEFNQIVSKFKRDEVLVGIPEAETERKEDEPINNATLLAINEFGSPQNNIPPRPVMAIGIKNAQEEIAAAFKQGAREALSRGTAAVARAYGVAGSIAANSIKKAINAQEGIEPPSQATLEARKSKGFKGTKALIVTGQLRNAITYIVKGEK